MNHLLLLLVLLFSALSAMSGQLVGSPRALDALLQGFAYKAFVRPRTGVVYDGVVSSNLTGIKVSAMRLRSGSLRSRGVRRYQEFEIPQGVVVRPYVERLVFVYQNLGNWSMAYYPLNGYTYLAPVLGLLAYDASDLMARNLLELDIRVSRKPISIHFSDVRRVLGGSVPKCVWFSLNGSVSLSNVMQDNVCTTFQQGHFTIAVVESPAPAPSPAPALAPSPPISTPTGATGKGEKSNNSKVGIIVGSVVGGCALLVMLVFLVVWVSKYKQGKKMHQMERAADAGEALQMTTVGSTKAPAATGTRTQPNLETEYVP